MELIKIKSWILLFIINIMCIKGQTYIAPGVFGDDLFNIINDNYKTSTTLGYNNARDIMYSEIDIKEDNQLTGVYSGYTITLDLSQDPSTNAYEQGINCEHTWPQSLGAGSEPMKSDIHHLFPTKSNVNSSRGNDPFEEINNNLTDKWYRNDYYIETMPTEFIDEYAEKYNPPNQNDERFEPREEQKGNTARAMVYFYTMYSEVADNDFWILQKETLLNWHYYDPVDEIEYSRTWEIANYQENIPNPFVIDPTLIWRVYFSEEYVLGDINNDESIDVLDVVLMSHYVLGTASITEIQIHQSDFNADFLVNVVDVILLVGSILG